MFTRLRTKLTVLYAGLFAATLAVVSIVAYSAIASNAEKVVRGQLQASGAVFDRIWALRARQLQDGAALLSRDFGFREAIATNDEATIRSALDNLRTRLGVDLAFIVGADGRLTTTDGAALGGAASDVLGILQGDQGASGVFVIGDTPYEAISAPILSPTLMGWVVFASKLDDKEMSALERLSAIPLDASVVHRTEGGVWAASGADHASRAERAAVNRFVAQALANRTAAPRELAAPDGSAIALVKPLPTMTKGAPVVLLLRYPLARALAPYRSLLETIAAIGLLGVLLLLGGSWTLARSLTRPISALEEAARRLQKGESAGVVVETRDEIGSLAHSFNTMAAEIEGRERKITHLALHDPDTDLPNRVAIEREIAALLERPGQGRLLIVAALGVDRFAHVRGAIGYALAGRVIREIGARLKRLAPGGHIARLSTEVMGLAFEAADPDAARAFLAQILAGLETPLQLGDNTIDVSLTVGMAARGVHADGAGMLVERANIALDQARADRRKIAAFDAAAYGDPSGALSLMSEMRRSIVDGDLILHHQPKFDLRTRSVGAVEALVRWRHPTRGMLPPDTFIGMAEETGHIGALTEWVLARAIEEQAVLKAAGHDLGMSVNISGRLLGDSEFADRALALVATAEGPITFEVTETAVIENPELALRIIDRFAAAGIGISIDDYGTGLSSLAYLKQIKADELKIDKAFILAISESQRDALLVRSTIDLAHSLGLKVTAEGVETQTALALLAGMGCDVAQGYLIAKPMPLKELLMFLRQDWSVESTRSIA